MNMKDEIKTREEPKKKAGRFRALCLTVIVFFMATMLSGCQSEYEAIDVNTVSSDVRFITNEVMSLRGCVEDGEDVLSYMESYIAGMYISEDDEAMLLYYIDEARSYFIGCDNIAQDISWTAEDIEALVDP